MTQKQLLWRRIMKDPKQIVAYLQTQFDKGFNSVVIKATKDDIPMTIPIVKTITALDNNAIQIDFKPKK